MQDPPREENSSLSYTFAVGLLQIEIMLPMCHSLKEKRSVMARTLNHLRKLQPISVAEVGHQNLWGRAGIAGVAVSADRDVVDRILRATVKLVEHDRDVQLIDYSIEIL